MPGQVRSYKCQVCGWQGQAEVLDVGEAAPCPKCGQFMYPLSWVQTWGVAFLLIGGVMASVAAFILLTK